MYSPSSVSVGTLVTPDNVWANVQRVGRPSQREFSWDTANEKFWLPFLKPNSSDGFERQRAERLRAAGTVQPDGGRLHYAPPDPERPRSLTDEARADEIKDLIEATIKSEITKWRSRMRPALLRAQQLGWSREVSRRLEQQLKQLEVAKFEGGAQATTIVQRVKDEAARYASAQRVLTAVALNLPYTDVEAVVDQVRATRIHETRETEANYVLAVYVKAYPCGVFSVWLYYGTQTRRNF